MSRTLGAIVILASLGAAASSAKAGTNVKCALNEDRVWVYESVVDFNLAAKLKCGESVQITGRIKGYVKIQTQSGVEGYVADSAFPKSALPPEPVEKPNDVNSASIAALAHHAAAPSVDSPKPAAVVPVAAAVAQPARVAPVAVVNVPAVAAAVAVVTPAPVAAPAPQPAVVASAPPAPAPAPTPVVAAPQPVSHPAVTVVASAPPAPAPVPAAVSKPAAVAVRAPQPAAVAAAQPTPAPAPAAAAAPVPSQPAAAPVEITLATNSNSTPSDRATAESEPAAAVEPVAAPAPRPVAAPNPDDDEDTSAVHALEDETAGCAHFFSAYGLSPNQYKWIAQNRKKAFPTVCPAPAPNMVDFVVIFTHDVGFFNVTMPSPVHVDNNGFSDWTPMSTVDTALMTQSEANSSHHEYVWVFHTTRGAFDPARFSARRKPLFSKAETNVLGSHGGYKTVMDALTFIEAGNPTNR
jgi:hypothetical protein